MTDPDRSASQGVEPSVNVPPNDGVTGEDGTGKEGSGPIIRDVESLLAILAPVTADGSELWFRGHRDSSWRLEASTYRTRGPRLGERSMLDRFRQEAATTGAPYGFDDWGWITFAQHHKLPTRLLDWSQSPLVGLYFACERGADTKPEEVECDGEFFILDPNDLNEEAGDAGGGHPLLLRDGDPTLDNYRPGHDQSVRGKPRAVIAPTLFDRIRFQTGTFTVSQRPEEGEAVPQLASARSLERFIVPGDAKHHLRQQLATLGFNEVSIYRDLDRIATRIKLAHERVT